MGSIFSPFYYTIFIWLLYIIDKNKKVLLRIFDLDDEIVDDLDLEVNFNQNKLYIKFKKLSNVVLTAVQSIFKQRIL